MSCYFWHEIWYNLGYFVINGISVPIQQSSQNLILSPRPTLHVVSFLSTLFDCCWWIITRSFHHEDSLLPLLPSSRVLHPPYLESSILAHGSPCCWKRSHRHFPSNAVLKVLMSFIPRPPLSFGRHIVFHLTHAIFLCSDAPPHRNLRWMLTSLSTILVGNLKNEKK